MLILNHRLRPREEEIAAKVIDGEAIMINLANGIYYSMDKIGGLMWEMIEGRHSQEEMVNTIFARYDVSREQAQADVEQLLNELVRENLVTPCEDGVPTAARIEAEPQQKLPYEIPKLNIYRDMGDLLALDPPTPGFPGVGWREPDDGESL